MKTGVIFFCLYATTTTAFSQVFRVTTLSVVTDGVKMKPGKKVTLPIVLKDTSEMKPAALEWVMEFPPEVKILQVQPSVAARSAEKELVCSPSSSKCILAGFNKAVLDDGEVAYVTVRLPKGFRGGKFGIARIVAITADIHQILIEGGPKPPIIVHMEVH